MATPKQEIRRIIREKNDGIKTGTQAMLDILKQMQKQVLSELGRLALGTYDYYHLKQTLPEIEYQIRNFTSKAELEAAGLLEKYWGRGQALVDAPLAASGIHVGFGISTSSLDALKDFTLAKIKGLGADALDKIRAELILGVLGQKTPQEVAQGIGLNLKDPGIFKSIALRAEAITQTEMGRVFSQAAQLRMEEALPQVEGLEKQWRHAGHPKMPRPAHVAASGKHVPVDKPFIINGIKMMFPRDPAAPISEVIHCGCDTVPYHPRWEN